MHDYDSTYRPFDFCTGVITPSSPGDENIWFWLKHATYSGTKTFLENTVDVWVYNVSLGLPVANIQYHKQHCYQVVTDSIDIIMLVSLIQDKVNENYYQVGVFSNDANRPLYFLSSTAIGLTVFDSYENSTPPESVFDLPSSCISNQKSSVEAKPTEHKSSMNVFNFKV